MKLYIEKPAFLINLFIATVLITGCGNRACESPVFGFRIINSYPHDTLAFTEGLSLYDGCIVEGTGIPGYSSLRKYRLKTGDMIDFYSVSNRYFAEGITIFNKKVAQITEDANIGFIYDLNDFNLVDSFEYNSRGWGITWDGKDLIMSDGSEKLYFIDTINFDIHKTLEVSCCDTAVKKLNEMEYVNGEIYANIWPGSLIACISPTDGRVNRWIDLEGIFDPEEISDESLSELKRLKMSIPEKKEACPNGIAYDPINDRLFVTGKLWPRIFEIEIQTYFK